MLRVSVYWEQALPLFNLFFIHKFMMQTGSPEEEEPPEHTAIIAGVVAALVLLVFLTLLAVYYINTHPTVAPPFYLMQVKLITFKIKKSSLKLMLKLQPTFLWYNKITQWHWSVVYYSITVFLIICSAEPITIGHPWSFAIRVAIPATLRLNLDFMKRMALLRQSSAKEAGRPPQRNQ